MHIRLTYLSISIPLSFSLSLSLHITVFFYLPLSLNTMYLLEHNQPALSVLQLSPRAAFTAQFMERALAFWRSAGFCFGSVSVGGRRYLCSDSQARPNRNMNLYHFLVVAFTPPPSSLCCAFFALANSWNTT